MEGGSVVGTGRTVDARTGVATGAGPEDPPPSEHAASRVIDAIVTMTNV
jgi:hypothetical protein